MSEGGREGGRERESERASEREREMSKYVSVAGSISVNARVKRDLEIDLVRRKRDLVTLAYLTGPCTRRWQPPC